MLKNTKSIELGFSFPMCTVKNFNSVTHTELFTWGKLIFYDIMLYNWFVTFFSGLGFFLFV